MPLPMVHLAIAVKICEQVECTLDPDFLLGSIAPDAIHMRPKTVPHDKLYVHLSEVVELRYMQARKLLTQYLSDTHGTMGFVDGYVAHLLTDYLWQERMIDPFQKRLSQALSPGELRKLYYQETDQIDFNLYQKMPWRAQVWSMLAAAQTRNFASLLTSEEIGKWRDRVLRWFEEIKQEPVIKPIHITYIETQHFIDQVAVEINKTLKEWKPPIE